VTDISHSNGVQTGFSTVVALNKCPYLDSLVHDKPNNDQPLSRRPTEGRPVGSKRRLGGAYPLLSAVSFPLLYNADQCYPFPTLAASGIGVAQRMLKCYSPSDLSDTEQYSTKVTFADIERQADIEETRNFRLVERSYHARLCFG